jgi:hypothetical protein
VVADKYGAPWAWLSEFVAAQRFQMAAMFRTDYHHCRTRRRLDRIAEIVRAASDKWKPEK